MSLVLSNEPSSLVAVCDQCAAVEAWAQTCESVPELQDASNRLAAIDEYLARTSTEGRSRVAAAMRRLEMRIGSLLPSEPGRRTDLRPVPREGQVAIASTQRHDFRQMAEHSEVVEQVIAESTDEAPASRRKVMDRIREAKDKHPVPTGSGKSRAEVAAKVDKARELAARGFTSKQIADEIGIAEGGMYGFRQRHGIEVPADAQMAKQHRVRADRVVSETAASLEGLVLALDLIDPSDVDQGQVWDWIGSIESSLSKLRRFTTQMKEAARAQVR